VKTIIISRTDGIGDVVLTLPLAGLLKEKYPDCTIVFLCASYTSPVVKCCEHVDVVLDWSALQSEPESRQMAIIHELRADVILHVFPRREIARLARRAGVPKRIGTSHRLYNLWYCNNLVSLGRKNSPLHEAQLNILLAQRLLPGLPPFPDQLYRYYGLTRIPTLSDTLYSYLKPAKFNLILHTRSRGSAVEWKINQWQEFIALLPPEQVEVFLTGTAEEGQTIRAALGDFPHVTDMTGKLTLGELVGFIHAADGLIAASTGPLHIAAALGKPVVGLFSDKRPVHPGRWAPLGERATYLEGKVDEQGILNIRPESVFKRVQEWLV
jgi:heptosyltransferase-3